MATEKIEFSQVVVHESKTGLIEALTNYLEILPADTKSVQMCVYAYTDTYEDYNDKKTKCTAEFDDWFNLPEDVRIALLGDAVTSTLKSVGMYVTAPEEEESDLIDKQNIAMDLKLSFKRLSRSFNIYMENIDTAAVAQVQLERLFEGILAYGDREVFTKAFDIFRQRKTMDGAMVDLHWKLLSHKKLAKKAVEHATAPANKAAAAKSPTVKAPIRPEDSESATDKTKNG